LRSAFFAVLKALAALNASGPPNAGTASDATNRAAAIQTAATNVPPLPAENLLIPLSLLRSEAQPSLKDALRCICD
jgi:hypothetical protein